MVRIAGSHHIFERAGRRPFSVPVHRNHVKAVYLRLARKLAEEAHAEDMTEEEEEEGEGSE